jgi:hypothetical protein
MFARSATRVTRPRGTAPGGARPSRNADSVIASASRPSRLPGRPESAAAA